VSLPDLVIAALADRDGATAVEVTADIRATGARVDINRVRTHLFHLTRRGVLTAVRGPGRGARGVMRYALAPSTPRPCGWCGGAAATYDEEGDPCCAACAVLPLTTQRGATRGGR
jgi:hypothetical protein